MSKDNAIYIPIETHGAIEAFEWVFEENIPYFFYDFLIQCGATKFLIPSSMKDKYERWELPEYVWKRIKFLQINTIQKFENEIFDYYMDLDKFNTGHNNKKCQVEMFDISSLISQIAICNKYDCSTAYLLGENKRNFLKEAINCFYREEFSIPLINILNSLKYDEISTVKLTSNIDKLRIDEIFSDGDFVTYSNYHANLRDQRFSLPDLSEKIKKISKQLVDRFHAIRKNSTTINIIENVVDIGISPALGPVGQIASKGSFEFYRNLYMNTDQRFVMYEMSKIFEDHKRRLHDQWDKEKLHAKYTSHEEFSSILR